MNRFILIVSVVLSSICSCTSVQDDVPYLQENEYGATQLVVDGNPFLMLAGELHNSSSSVPEYAAPLFSKVRDMNLNTVIASVSWEQFEPREGHYDFTLPDMLIRNAERNNLKLVLLWFGTWKNGQSSYVPMWVKQDTDRFFRIRRPDGANTETVSPFCNAARDADAKAFSALMRHIKEVDKNRTVIMVQPENEVGAFQDIDYNDIALTGFEENVPDGLMSYLVENKPDLQDQIYGYWESNGFKTQGTWKEVFGDNPYAKSYYMTWAYASYIEHVAKSGRAEYDLPMYVNAWIVQYTGQLPGLYPNGGPVSDVMDIYRAAAPSVDILSPDIYRPNFKEIVAMYHTDRNPLLIPESTLNAGRAYYAFAQHDAICYSPFGIEDGASDVEFICAYGVLDELMPLITRYQGSGLMAGVLKEGDEQYAEVLLGSYMLKVEYDRHLPAYGIIIHDGEDGFIVAGMNMIIRLETVLPGKVGYIGEVYEGHFENGEWVTDRMLNGDETWHHEVIRVMGRQIVTEKIDESGDVRDSGMPFQYSPNRNVIITTPGIYKVRTYLRD